MNKSTHFNLLFGYERGWQWRIRTRVLPNGSFHNKGVFDILEIAGAYTPKIRDKDRKWVQKHLPRTFRKRYPENDHDWDNNAIMRILTHDEHVNLEQRRRKKNAARGN